MDILRNYTSFIFGYGGYFFFALGLITALIVGIRKAFIVFSILFGCSPIILFFLALVLLGPFALYIGSEIIPIISSLVICFSITCLGIGIRWLVGIFNRKIKK